MASRSYFDELGNRLDLCESCAACSAPSPVQKMLLPALLTPVQPMQQSCPRCRTTLQDLKHSSLLGCPECYRFFREPLVLMLRQMHGATVHQGRRPQRRLRASLAELRERLERAVAEERYEDAAVARDEIRAMGNP